MKWCLVSLCLLLSNVLINGNETTRQDAGFGRTRQVCSGIGKECQCRRGRHSKQAVICTKENCMHEIPTSAIPRDQVRNVVSLVITKQPNITTVGDSEIRRLANIEVIRITRCNISRVSPYAFVGLGKVQKLDLRRNQLKSVPNAIKQLSNLEYLNLGGNKLTTIDRAAFYANRNLKRIILRRNFLVTMPTMLPKSLTKITLSRNSLSTLGNLEYLENLKMLFADGNRVTEFPQLPHSVRIVSLCSNLIDEEISLHAYSNLTAINLNNNKNIGDITMSTFAARQSRSPLKLRRFEARNSGIRSVTPNAFRCLGRLKLIDLSHNEIRQYRESWFTGNKALKSVRISGNPFSCTCDVKSSLKEIASIFKRQRKSIIPEQKNSFDNDFDDVHCQTQGRNDSCLKFSFVRRTCTDIAYKKDAVDRTTTTTTIRSTTIAERTERTTENPMIKYSTTSSRVATTTRRAPTSKMIWHHMSSSSSPKPPSTITDAMVASPTTSSRQDASATSKTSNLAADVSTRIVTSTSATSTTTPLTTTTSSTKAPITTTKTSVSTAATTLATPTTTHSTKAPATTTKTSASTSATTLATPMTTHSTKATTTDTTTRLTSSIKSTTLPPRTTTSTTVATTTTTTTTATTSSTTTTTATTTSTKSTTTVPTTTSTVSKNWCLRKTGERCHFPFIADGVEANECLGSWGGPWCSKTRNYDIDDEWDYCVEC